MLWKNSCRWLILLSLITLLGGCSASLNGEGNQPSPKETGTVLLTASGWAEGTPMSAQLVFERGRHSFTKNVTVMESTADLGIEVPVGTWDIAMMVFDEADNPLYQDSAEAVTVLPDHELHLSFQLRPADGLVSLSVELNGYPNADEILRARVHFNDAFEEITVEPGENLAAEYEVPPGSYNFKVELFTGSFRSTDQIDPGIWTLLDVYSQQTAEVTWRPAQQEIHIDADIFLIPEAPHLEASLQEDSVDLAWTHTSNSTTESFVLLWRTNPFEPFDELAEVPAADREYQHSLDDLADDAAFVEYTICAVSHVVQGYRSSPVQLSVD